MATALIAPDYNRLLNEARAAYHDLITGRAAKVMVDQNGERVEFAMTSAPKLAQYIHNLERMIGNVPSGPMGVLFA